MAFYRGTRYDDDFAGTSGNDTFSFASVHLGPGDRVQGGAGIDNVQLGQVGPGPAWQLDAADLDAFDSIETYTLSFGIGRFTLSDALVGRAEGRRVSIVVGVGVNPVTLTDASALTGDHRIAFFGYAPNHHVLGGAGNDTFQFIYGLSTATVIDGGAGTDTLILADVAQTAASLTGIASIEELHLSGTSTGVTLDDAFLARNGVDGRLVVNAVAADSTIDASAVTNVQHALDLSIYTGAVNATGGAGADIFRHVYGFGGIATIAGGEGNAQDQLVLKAASDYGAGFFDTITGIERVVLGTGGSSLVVTDALVASAWDDRLVVVGSAGDDVVDARGVAAGRRVEMVAGSTLR